ncbi:MAG: ABC transporter ATP-binding protein [Fusobacteriaceae bacterium]|nr:ABC transporter ATP-binding protein [Fusobacteriaceae bacterium]MBP6323120.1 ABC transporter ATP-binding protein [Fusobacteriaceae bacterium]
MNNENEIVLKMSKINKHYIQKNENLHILKDLELEVRKGDFISIVGKSGSGKSTLLNLMGILDKPDSGELLINGLDITNAKDVDKDFLKNKNLGFVFQFHYLLHEFTALENVMLPALVNNSKSEKEIKAKAKELLKIVGLEERENHKPTQLSGGEKQRVAIARALINSPKIILADEPTGNLDEETSEMIHNLLIKINKELKQTIIVVTHSKELANITSKILILKKGKLELY